ncbi:MAG: hypothetical protein K9M75_08780, partial [Phycisphaerae bacterium]|nr:hypothetical protein [Phycisphaerae bacterium]
TQTDLIGQFEMNNVYCLMYNEGFGLTAEAILYKYTCYANPLIVIGYIVSQADFGQFELFISSPKRVCLARGFCFCLKFLAEDVIN